MVDDDANSASDDDDATVTFSNIDPSVTVTKTASPVVVPESGGPVTFTVVVTNDSPFEPVTITDLVDDRFGDLLGSDAGLTGGATATSCNDAVQAPIVPGGTFACTIDASLAGNAGSSHTNTVTATAVDADTGSTPATDDDDATVTFSDVAPVGDVGQVSVSDHPSGDRRDR